MVSLGDKEKEHGLSCTAFSWVTKPSNIGILGRMTQNRLIHKIKHQSKMDPRIREEKCLINLWKGLSQKFMQSEGEIHLFICKIK